MSLIRRFATPLSGQTQRSAPELAASLQAACARCRPEAELLQPREAAPSSCTGTTHRGAGIAMLICAAAMTLG